MLLSIIKQIRIWWIRDNLNVGDYSKKLRFTRRCYLVNIFYLWDVHETNSLEN